MQINKDLSAAISVARGLALFSIVSAHIVFLKGTPAVFSNFYANFGTIGVVAYYIISGFLFEPEHYGGFLKMLKNKAKAIGLPWVILGSTVYFYKVYFTRVYSLKAHVKWLLGKNTYLYFITVLLLCFVICYLVKNKAALWGFVALNILSLELTAFGVLQPAIAFLRITNNLNIFNWLGFFALGRLARGLNGEGIYSFLKKARVWLLLLFVGATALLLALGLKSTYISHLGWLYELLGAAAIFGAATFAGLKNPVLQKISNDSFAVYLTHFLIIELMNRVCHRVFAFAPPLQLFANLFVIGVTVAAIELLLLLARGLKISPFVCAVFGVRGPKAKLPKGGQATALASQSNPGTRR